MNDRTQLTMASAIQRAYDESLQDWHRQHAPATTEIDLFAGPLASIVVETAIFARGVMNCTVAISGRRRHEDQVYFYRFLRRARDQWTFKNGSLNL